jgi:16S rRNA (guanine527-N7)-methyltransferase
MDRVLMDWSARHNLIARSTIPDRWRRHYLDSAQLAPLLPAGAKRVVDMGAGAGFPGLALAALLAERGACVILIEATQKKAAFLRAAAAAMGLSNVAVIPERIERAALDSPPDIVTARALAPLDKLLDYAHGFHGESTRDFLFKGQHVEDELTRAAKSWHMDVKRHKSVADPGGVILEIGNLARVSKP